MPQAFRWPNQTIIADAASPRNEAPIQLEAKPLITQPSRATRFRKYLTAKAAQEIRALAF
jgi:hypothetical protein